MRAGFQTMFHLDMVKTTYTARDLKLLIAGSDSLNIGELKAAAVARMDQPPVKMQSFHWLFEWLAEQPISSQRLFMRFVTGSPSLSVRPLEFSGLPLGSMFPLSHTCMHWIELPEYQTRAELEATMNEAIHTESIDLS